MVVDCVCKPLRAAVLQNRLKNAEQLVSSVSFTEFSRMLQSLPANVYLKDNHGRYVFSSQTWHHLNTDDDPDWTIRGKTDLDIRKDKENAKRALESDLELIRKNIFIQIRYRDENLWGADTFDAYRWLIARNIMKLQDLLK